MEHGQNRLVQVSWLSIFSKIFMLKNYVKTIQYHQNYEEATSNCNLSPRTVCMAKQGGKVGKISHTRLKGLRRTVDGSKISKIKNCTVARGLGGITTQPNNKTQNRKRYEGGPVLSWSPVYNLKVFL